MSDTAPTAAERSRTLYPARSKMIDMYAGEIAGLLAEGRLEDAERAALDIPHIAIALAEADLHSSADAYRDWCVRWVQPDFGADTYSQWYARSDEGSRAEGPGIPFGALRALRLRRRAREVPMPVLRTEQPLSTGAPQAVTCALLGAVFRWYEQEGRYQQLVQTNLARLGVLR